jgi:SAM-dependent methyltransferase
VPDNESTPAAVDGRPVGLDPSEGRRLYGDDPSGYDAGRPDYPTRLYDLLERRWRARAGASVLEIGPGTGRVTRRLLDSGAKVTAVEPNTDMAAWLMDSLPGEDVHVVVAPLEDAELPDASFDLAVAATSFHWVRPGSGLPKLRRVLRPDAWLALWWTLFEDPSDPDEFDRQVVGLLGASPGGVEPGRPPFQVDERARLAELRGAGFVDTKSEILRSHHRLDADDAVALYSTMAIVLRRPEPERAKLLDALRSVVADRFGGEVTRTYVTALYTARNPSSRSPQRATRADGTAG